MLAGLSLRLRIFLFFCLLAAGGAAVAAGALGFGWSRGGDLPAGPFLTALVLFVFLNTGMILGIWLLFDENVAKPINRLSAGLRLRAHAGVESPVSPEDARYLGDLAPAAHALSETMGASVMDSAARVARETQRLRAESERLTALLTEIPIATILLNPVGEIVLYDGQAADVLSEIAPPRLKAPLSDYFDTGPLTEMVAGQDGETAIQLREAGGGKTFAARVKRLGDDGHMILIDAGARRAERIAPRPLVFDFDLMAGSVASDINDTALKDLCFVPFDTETTGLSVERDAIVQLGALRVVGGRIVEGEVIDTHVAPGRPIPAASARIHGVRDADVVGAPGIGDAGRAFHQFARGAVLVAHNAPFDIGLLRKSEDEMGVAWDHPVLDTVLLSAVVFGTGEDHSLDALCARLLITIPEAGRHTAIGDARATAEVLVRLLPLLEGKGLGTFGAVLAETRKHGRLLRDLNG
ncbi:3'-5' exonuclease [Ovoidimarina sediminis]|uniref:3'-5' exonuclease n=1 Tax=Ovoidimarina sediminis TaxID=3079856 RepID=UPI0029117709|nr:3'-5' exonuclease [Rhodophyticola sp. MJ-SS7]MDU8943168.1 3'-5' exonuclease [Rhodophyticola sp. MJ-SS7]